MGVREQLNQHKPVVLGVMIVVILVAGYAIVSQLGGTSGGGPGDAYFTIDDGQTFFADDAKKLTPFDKDGKPAVRAHVFQCGGERVVGYLSRYTEKARQAQETAKSYEGSGKAPPNLSELASVGTTGTELKKPGDATWISAADMASATKIRTFRCKDGSEGIEVQP